MAATMARPAAIGSSGAPHDAAGSDASRAFRFPPVHAFPPFYTLQPNPVSRSQQLSQWRTLILDFCRYHRIFTLAPLPTRDAPTGHGEAADPHKSLFANRAIQRSLSPEAIRTILSDLVDHKQAAWDDASGKKNASSAAANTNAKALIYWKSPAQWGDAIYDWVFATGQNKSIMTLFELSHGDLVQGQGKSCEAGGARPSTDADRLNTFISCRFLRVADHLAASGAQASQHTGQGADLCRYRSGRR